MKRWPLPLWSKEGFERGTTNELLAFLYIARGSAGEVRSMLTLLSRRPWMAADVKSQISVRVGARAGVVSATELVSFRDMEQYGSISPR